MYTFLISFKNLLPFYYYRKAAFCYRLPKNHLISGELITCQTVGMLFVFLRCTVELVLFLCLCFVFCSLLEREIWNKDIHKSYQILLIPISLSALLKKDVQVVKLLKKGINESSTSRHQLFLKRLLKGSGHTLSRIHRQINISSSRDRKGK